MIKQIDIQQKVYVLNIDKVKITNKNVSFYGQELISNVIF